MKRRILFSDFDGTLFVGGRVSEEDRLAVQRWREAGNLFAMATGRQHTNLRDRMAKESVGYDFLLVLNGSEAYDRDGRLLFAHAIDAAILPGLYDTLVEECGWANVCFGDRLEMIAAPHCKRKKSWLPPQPMERLATFECFSQICTDCEDLADSLAAQARVAKAYGDHVIAQLNGTCLDVTAIGVNKASGIRELADHLGMTENDIVCVGDNFNDLSMLTAFRSYAMAHGPKEVREHASGVTASVAELIDILLSE